jgi:hypothetical protein
MKKILFLIAFVLLTFASIAEKKTIIIVDKKTKEELIAASVIVNDSVLYTDFDGVVVIDTPAKIKIEYPSYESVELEISDSQIVELKSK